ncbi:putative secreted protein [Streptomyces glaucescens]|uniref:Putative secreted protein n=2 Tax=Streptomyces glaucescens TaxID=1907 RepID=A0A089XLX9_STRGA|nr:putative secreted protein [Streptomyces glaucescens]
MPKPLRMSRRTLVAAWAVLCAAGVAATAALNASSAPDPQSGTHEGPVSAECAEYIADIEARLARAREAGTDDGVVALSRVSVDADDCSDELREHFSGDR